MTHSTHEHGLDCHQYLCKPNKRKRCNDQTNAGPGHLIQLQPLYDTTCPSIAIHPPPESTGLSPSPFFFSPTSSTSSSFLDKRIILRTTDSRMESALELAPIIQPHQTLDHLYRNLLLPSLHELIPLPDLPLRSLIPTVPWACANPKSLLHMPARTVSQSPSLKQHHRLAPAPAVASSNQGPSTARLGEYFDLIKNEFDTVSQDGIIWKQQRDQYEEKCMSRCFQVPAETRLAD